MHFSSPTSSSPQNPISNPTNSLSTNNVLLLPSNTTSKMSFIIPNNNTNNNNNNNSSQQQQQIISTPTSGLTTSINSNGINSISNVSLSSGQTTQQRLSFPQRTTSQSQQIPQEEFAKILRVLQENNMTESVEIFKKEYQSLFNKTTSSFSEPYFTALDGYISYVQEQPDTSRHEFSQLIYPLFVHMYLDLVEKDHADEAQGFFKNYVQNTNLQATVFASHKDDLFRIKSLITKEQIAQSEYVKSFRHNGRYWIKLCNASLELLDQFLIKQQKYPLLTKIVQAYFQLEINDGSARNAETQRLLSGGRLGEIKTEDNTNRMYYGLLRDHDLTRILQHKAILSSSTGADNEDGVGDDQPSTSKNRKKLKKDFFNQRQSKASLKVDPNAPQLTRIPIPELREHERMDLINTFQEDYSRMLKITPDNLPSCCYYTLLNGYLEINCLEVSEDSTLLAVGCKNSSIYVYSLNRRKLITMKLPSELERLDKSNEHIYEQMMTNDDSKDNTNQNNDSDILYNQRLLCGHTGPIYGLSMSREKWFLLSCSEDYTIRLWSLLTWSCLITFRGHTQPVFDVQFGPFGHYFASCSLDKTARLWCIEHAQTLRIYTDGCNDIETLCFHPNSNYIATSSSDRILKIWDLLESKEGQQMKPIRQMSGHKLNVCILKFSKDGRYLISAGYDRQIMIWDCSNGSLVTCLLGHSDAIFSMDLSRDGSILCTGSADFSIRIWNFGQLIKDKDDGKLDTLQRVTPSAKYELVTYRTKRTSTTLIHFTRRNLLLGFGVFIPPNDSTTKITKT
ncbi:unnamed protein product [Adineta steineri]|uniref:TFIID subunit TAF5 NTD2 domain-containing protein n=1 Tax=Adineta steineri TaxID=433720 RepID=A0A819LX77_9BILA|nr:unnamed protein product [Adineta steineri]CAF3971003.1 unnamed protein product [Adineta steineri]